MTHNLRKETVCSKFKNTWQGIARMYNAQAAGYGGTISVGYFLLNIDSKEGTYASTIAPQLGMESTSLSRIIKKLEKEKLIYRETDKLDKRKVKIFLTDEGQKSKSTAKQIVKDFNNRVIQKIGEERVAVFFEIADIINKVTEEK